MNLLALDLSLTSIGWAAQAGDPPVASGTFIPRGTGAARLASVAGWLDSLLVVWKPNLTLIEGYSFGSRMTRAHALGELGGVVRHRLFERSYRFVEIAPKVRAKFATGKGNASKDEVLVETVKRMGYAGHSNDEADALWILETGRHQYLLPGRIALPKGHLLALDNIEWPRDVRAA